MLVSVARAAILVFALLAGAGAQAAEGGNLADFNAAVERAEAHNRVALGYLRTGNYDLAALEIDRLRAAWGQLSERFSDKRPDAFDNNPVYVEAMTDIATRLVTVDLMVKMGKADGARQSLAGIRADLYKLRSSAGIVVLADCVYDANAAMDALMVYNDPKIDLSKQQTRDAITAKAKTYRQALDRCDATASATVRKNDEFRRLIDGARNGLAPLPHALETRDVNQLHRILIELRSFDNLLAFRFG
jgi:hypothetical protein